MPKPNIYDPDFDEPRNTVDGFHASRARLGYQLGTERLGLSLWSIPAGQTAYPYHFHLAEEEVLVLLEGDLALRTPTGWERVRRGDVVRFPVGEDGAHQLVNDGAAEARFLAISTHGQPDVVHLPRRGQDRRGRAQPGRQGAQVVLQARRRRALRRGHHAPRGRRCGSSVS